MNRYRMNQIKIGLDIHKESHLNCLKSKVAGKLGVSESKLNDFQIVRQSLDCRKNHISWVYSVEFILDKQLKRPEKSGCQKLDPIEEEPLKKGTKTFVFDEIILERLKSRLKDEHKDAMYNSDLSFRPVIVGFGPAGMFAALTLARAGYRPVILERGKDVDSRTQDVNEFWNGGQLNLDSNVQFGEGGAGTFSDGKLTTGIGNRKIKGVLNDLISFGGPPEIAFTNKAHIGTDILVNVVKNLRKKVIELGGSVYFSHRVEDIIPSDSGESLIVVKNLENKKHILIGTRAVVLSMGHSARDTFLALYDRGVEMKQKPFSIGVRIEHPQQLIDKAQYKDSYDQFREILPPADYKLSHRCANGRGVYTFCMCPGGEIIQSASEEAMAVTNGMSMHKRDSGKANSGLLVDVRPEDFESSHPLAGVDFQRKYEALAYKVGGYGGVKASWFDLRDGNERGMALASVLPDFAVSSIKEAMPHLGRKIQGFDGPKAMMIGVETRSSSPVRFVRRETLESNFDGLYPCGEGPGYAGGIMSAACDGIKVAEEIIRCFGCN